MLAEIFSDLIEGKLRHSGREPGQDGYLDLADLQPLFDHIGLPLPEEGVDISKTREGGYNLMLNSYGAVLRLYPSMKEGQTPEGLLENLPDVLRQARMNYLGMVDKGRGMPFVSEDTANWREGGNLRLTHMYHPNVLPVIGRVQFDGFAMQLMPGRALELIDRDDVFDMTQKIADDISCSEFSGEAAPDNYTRDQNGHMELIDTVYDLDNDGFDFYSIYDDTQGKTFLDATLEKAVLYEELQLTFFSAWSGDIAFSEFWDKMKQAKENGLLVDGWNNNPDPDSYSKKIEEYAKRYEERLEVELEI